MKKLTAFLMSAVICLSAVCSGFGNSAVADATGTVYPVTIDTSNRAFAWPVPASNGISGCFEDGRNHGAIDITAPLGTDVVASADGNVTLIKDGCSCTDPSTGCNCNGGAGNYVVIQHNINNNIYLTVYMHLSKISVSAGQSIKQGEKIGEVGSSGNSGGYHLDFSIRSGSFGGSRIDPGYTTKLPSTLVYSGSSPSCCLPYLKSIASENKNPITVVPTNTPLTITPSSVPSSIKKGASFNLTGSITSGYNITSFKGDILSGSTAVQTVSTTPNSTYVDIQSSAVNQKLIFGNLSTGTYTLRYIAKDSNGASKSYTKVFSVYNDAASTLTISPSAVPTSVKMGTSFDLTGTVKSNYTINSFKGEILYGSTVKQTYSYNPNSTSVNIQSSSVNKNLIFSSLGVGSYTLRYTARDSSGTTKTYTKSFSIYKPVTSTLTIKPSALPTSVKKGSTFNLTGTITSNLTITNFTGQILQGSVVKQNVSYNPNAKTVYIQSSTVNQRLYFNTLAPGSYTLKYTAKDASGTTKTYVKSFSVYVPAAASTPTISPSALPSSIKKGSSFNLTGTVSSNYNITSFNGQILQGSTVKQSITVTPNAKTLNIQPCAVNQQLIFGNLAAGSYTLKYTAKDASGTTKTYVKSFSVYVPAAASTLSINPSALPSSFKQGTSFNLTGTVTSNYTITSFNGQILQGSTVKQSVTVNPNSTYLNIQPCAVNQKLLFNTLPAGTYTLRYTAKDAHGATTTFNRTFTVTSATTASTLRISPSAVPTSIRRGASYNLTGTITSNYNVTNFTGQILQGSTVKQSVSVAPYAKTVNIQPSAVNQRLIFGNLAAGSYVLRYTVKDASGASRTYNKSFTVY